GGRWGATTASRSPVRASPRPAPQFRPKADVCSAADGHLPAGATTPAGSGLAQLLAAWMPHHPPKVLSFYCRSMMSRSRTIGSSAAWRSEEHTSELQSRSDLVCRLLLEKKKKN